MTLDPQLQVMLDQIASLESPAPEEQTPEEARLAYEVFSGLGSRPDGVSVEEIGVAGAQGRLAARRYRPEPVTEPVPGLVYFHGGGYVIGSLDSHDGACAHLAAASGCIVISVDYRLAPEHPLPAAIDDGLAAHRDIVSRATELGLDPERIAVGGDSAGGHLSINVALAARDGDQPRPAALVLIYPVTDWELDQPSLDENAEGYVLTKATMLWFRAMSVPDDADHASPRFSPLRHDLHGLPPTVVVTARFDPLRDQGNDFAARLADAGVDVRHTEHPDLIHTFIQVTDVSERCRAATEQIGRELGKILNE